MSDVDRFERRLREAGEGTWESAPSDLIAAAKALIPARPTVRLGFLTLGAAVARDGDSRRQAVLTPPEGMDGPRLRLAAERTREGWEVVGRAEGLVQAAHTVEEGEDGAFRFVAPTLEETGFRLVAADGVFEVPPLSEAP
ncbi:hypothetical protein EON81_20380 [bacterium]|nr:MAG: hypothetical protein EON81_20380 [bacterium]